MTRPFAKLALSLFVVLAVLSCRKSKPLEVIDSDGTAPPAVAADVKGLLIRLSHADPAAADRPAPKLAEAKPLDETKIKAVLARLPKLEAEASDQKDFAVRKGSLPPPKTGTTVLGAFPPAPAKPGATPRPKGPLSVVRFAPEGDVPLAPHLSVTFSDPMVAVTSLDALAAGKVPVRLEPTPKGAFGGKWRWVGTKTLLFEPTERFPMATRYEVTVPKGTKSAVGNALDGDQRWTFTTPPPTVQITYPADQPARRQPLMFVSFDQRIDAAKVAATITLHAGARKATEVKVRLAKPEEIDADETVSQLRAQAEDGRWLAFVPMTALPSDSPVQVSIGPGTPSAEGPLTTTTTQSFSFRTYGPMKVSEHRCGYDGQCPPGSPFEIVFTNPVEAAEFDASLVKVEPPLPGLRTEVYGEYLYVYGATRGRTRYEVTLSPQILDQFGQRLGKSPSLDFKVTEAPENLFIQGSGLTVLDPAAGGKMSVFSVNHRKLKVRAWAVEPKDWREYLLALEKLSGDSREVSMPGRKVIDDVITVRRANDEVVETPVDLSAALTKTAQGPRGHLVFMVEQTEEPPEPWMMQRAVAWVQVTDLGLQAHVDAERMLVWATSLADGSPKADVDVQLLHVGAKGRTDAKGLVSLPLVRDNAQIIMAKKGDDVAFLPESLWWWNPQGSWHTMEQAPSLTWYVFDDRGLYRPGEDVKIKGWLRTTDPGKGGDVGGLGGPSGSKVREVEWKLHDSQGNEVAKGKQALNAFGAFDTSIALPDTMNLGYGSLTLEAKGWKDSGAEHWHMVRVEEFRRPEYEVSARVSEGPHLLGAHAVATVEAAYYAGGGLANAAVHWDVTSSPGHYQPPGHDGFSFGRQIPWWMFWSYWGPSRPEDEPRVVSFDALTDAAGEHHLRMDFVSVDPPQAMSVSAQATVTDVNRQAWTSSTSLVVHPSSLYVGLRSDRAFVQAGEDIDVDVIVTDIDGKVVPGVSVLVKAVRVEYVQEHGEMVEKELDPQTCTKDSAAAAVRCSLAARRGGSHRLVAEVVDAKGRPNRTELTTWVAGGELPAPRDVSQEQVLLIPDRGEYEAGQVAKIAVSAPWADAQGLVTIRRSGIVDVRVIRLDGMSTMIEVPIEEAMTPSITVQVDLAGAAPRRGEDGKVDPKLPKRPAYAVGTAALSVPPRQRTLALSVEPGKPKIEPGGETTVAVQVKDAAGRPVADAEVALWVVDEAVLALTGYAVPDPLATFYGWRDPGVRDHYLRQQVLLASAGDLVEQAETAASGASAAPGGGGGDKMMQLEGAMPMADEEAPMAELVSRSEAPPPPPGQPAPKPEPSKAAGKKTKDGKDEPGPAIALRKDFSALALFSPSVRTDASGKASVPLKLPDNLTRYRIMAVAVAGERQFGLSESTITARLPLMVRPSPPRFLNFGDELELPVVLQNQTDAPMEVEVAMRAHNLELTGGQGRVVKVPANDRVEVRFPSRAQYAGTARVQVGAAAGTWADAATFELPVWTPATTEAFATYGELDEGGIVQPVQAPPGVFPQFGGLEISTSSTAVQALTDAVLYLVSYPFECSEQLASRVLAIAALRDVLEAFDAEGLPPPKELRAAVDRDLAKLRRMQTDDGGFSFWGRGWPSWPYLTVHVAHALERAHEKGFSVPSGMRAQALSYLAEIERHFDRHTPEDVRRVIRAYALYVQRLSGKPDARKAQILVDEVGVEKLPLEALAWVLPTLHEDGKTRALADRIERHLQNRATETAAMAHFATAYDDGAHLLLHSDRRADALVLEALMTTEPGSDLIPKLVRGLLGHRKAGRWSSTQENAFVLVALDRYFGQYEKATPDFVARAWVGETFAGKHEFRGRTTETHEVDVPMQWLADHAGTQDLVIDKKGPGRLYYRVGMRYAPRDLKLPPYDAGFVVERRYEAVDHEDDVRRDADGTWHIKAGARVRVRVTMVADGRRYHVALVDPLPAGLEVLNPALATTGALPPDPEDEGGGFWWWTRTWYEHQNMRDERVEAFTSLLWSGVYDYDYVARATTPGRFVVPPSKAEEMYHPETFGRGSGDVVVVE
ncbi:Ig-like domain-containing alpha-2-macroglobulin family protein [Paraliomyxa miuraensis]|uniref:Ig-like domain-containing alpha-2-macroglobulin family protein n=1 Tax=Paraliomyxa miuraensis TaxID=376150 RepID=UPI0022580770|nr:Ig-like domain-containing alpha-2-macroglobulin family protein [Paraliomyxa miuraensis]MCX4239452.1 MG2 domain-containing protein [Paraliomyxa miuraensis]